MRVLMIANDLRTITVFRKEIVQEFLNHGYEVTISTPALPDDVTGFESCHFIQNSITRFGTNPLKELRTVGKLRSQIKKIKPDVILTFTIKPNMYTLMVAGKTPVIPNVTGLSAFLFSKGFVPKAVGWYQNRLFKKAFRLFCQNRTTLEYYESQGFNNAVLLPGSGVNVCEILPRDYPEFSGTVECAFVARVQKDKGFWELIEASKKLPAYHFTVVGDGEDESIVKAMEECSNIAYVGRQSHEKTLDMIAASHVLILPSYHEGLANVLLEAQALARPVLTSDVPGCADAMRKYSTGMAFEVKSSDAIVDACNAFHSNGPEMWKKMGLEGRKFVEDHFDRRIVVGEYIKAVEEAVK